MTDTGFAITILLIPLLFAILIRVMIRSDAARQIHRGKSFACAVCGREAWPGTATCPRCQAVMPLEYVDGSAPGGFEVVEEQLPFATLVDPPEAAAEQQKKVP